MLNETQIASIKLLSDAVSDARCTLLMTIYGSDLLPLKEALANVHKADEKLDTYLRSTKCASKQET